MAVFPIIPRVDGGAGVVAGSKHIPAAGSHPGKNGLPGKYYLVRARVIGPPCCYAALCGKVLFCLCQSLTKLVNLFRKSMDACPTEPNSVVPEDLRSSFISGHSTRSCSRFLALSRSAAGLMNPTSGSSKAGT